MMMQRVVIILLFFLIINMPIVWAETDHAREEMVCYFPNTCSRIVNTVYLITNVKIHYVEIDCVTKDGEYVKYTETFEVKAPYFGMEKFIIPGKIVFRPWDEDVLHCIGE